MLHTHEVTGSSPVVSTKKKTTRTGGLLFLVEIRHRTRTHLNATVRWTVACRRSRRRQHIDFIEFCCLHYAIHVDGVICLVDSQTKDSNPSKCDSPVDCRLPPVSTVTTPEFYRVPLSLSPSTWMGLIICYRKREAYAVRVQQIRNRTDPRTFYPGRYTKPAPVSLWG